MQVDILVFGAHPDDVELGCGGTILKKISEGKKVGIVDLTQGELGTRGTAAIRKREAAKAAQVLGVSFRENLKMKDGFFQNDKVHQLKVIQKIREYRPEVVIATSLEDRHPDHGRAAKLISDACFLSGLVKITTKNKGRPQPAWRPKVIYHYIQYLPFDPDIVVDISAQFEKKMESICVFTSQFHDPHSKEPATLISSPEFLSHVRKRSEDHGKIKNVRYGEGFLFGTLNKELVLI